MKSVRNVQTLQLCVCLVTDNHLAKSHKSEQKEGGQQYLFRSCLSTSLCILLDHLRKKNKHKLIPEEGTGTSLCAFQDSLTLPGLASVLPLASSLHSN